MSAPQEPSPTVNGQNFNTEDLQDIAPSTPTEEVEQDTGEDNAQPERPQETSNEEHESPASSSPGSRRKGSPTRSRSGRRKRSKKRKKSTKKTKIRILRDNNPSYDIETPESDTSCKDLHIYHKHVLHRIMTDEVVQNYTNYLILAWMGLEWVAINVCKVDASGFAKAQIASLYKYKKQLIEIGERENEKGNGMGGMMSSWPPEVVLFVQSLVSLAILIAINYYLGNNASQETKQQTYMQAMNLKNNVESQAQEQGGFANLLMNLMNNGGGGGNLMNNLMGMFMGGGNGNNNQQTQQQEVYDE